MITRKQGLTILKVGKITIKTNLINRYKFNELRKRKRITIDTFFWAIRKKL